VTDNSTIGQKIVLTANIPEQAREWRNDHRVWQWCRQYTLIDKLSHERWLEKISSDPTIKMFGISSLPGKIDVGVCGFTSICLLNRKAEFSLYIVPEFQGKGYGKDALWTLLTHGFNDWGFNRIYGETYSDNDAFKMFLGLRMKVEGTMRGSYMRGGKMIDSIIVSMLKPEFDAINLKV